MPRYDRRYFDRWYRAPRTRVFRAAEVARRVAFVVAAAEFLLERPVRSVLDVCCGEGHWQPVLARLRPRARYVGVDASAYAVRRWGRRRNLVLGRFGEIGTLGLRGPFDLVVCAGALYYLPDDELAPGLAAIARLLGGVAFLEVFTDQDDLTGNVRELRRRPAREWSRRLRGAGLVHLGLHCWATERMAPSLATFELGRVQA